MENKRKSVDEKQQELTQTTKDIQLNAKDKEENVKQHKYTTSFEKSLDLVRGDANSKPDNIVHGDPTSRQKDRDCGDNVLPKNTIDTPVIKKQLSLKPQLATSPGTPLSRHTGVGLKRKPDGGGSDARGSDQSSVVDKGLPPVKRSRAKKMQGLTFEQSEMRRSRTNEQERERQRNISEALEALKQCEMPFNPYLNHKEDSKIYLLKTATAYIYGMSRMIHDYDRGLVHRCDHRLSQERLVAMHNAMLPNIFGTLNFPNGCVLSDSSSAAKDQPLISSRSLSLGIGKVDSDAYPSTYVSNLAEDQSEQRKDNESAFNDNIDLCASEKSAPQLSPYFPSFLHHPMSTSAEGKHKGDHYAHGSPSANAFPHSEETPSPQNPVDPTIQCALKKLLEDSYHQSTSKQISSLLNDRLNGARKSFDVASSPSLVTPLSQESRINLDASARFSGNSSVNRSANSSVNSSANSSGYMSMLSAHGNDDSAVFSPDRLQQTIDDMYSESFLAPTPTQRLHFDAF
ncbi:hypothetical protein BgiBS90_034499 [Biomphalaria glabrata]|nr:hypothetical protein BgiBS90_034499 [Biomphalaria glabrata]